MIVRCLLLSRVLIKQLVSRLPQQMTKTTTKVTKNLPLPQRSPHDCLSQHNVHFAILLSPSNPMLRTVSLVIFLFLSLLILSLLTSPDLNANEVVVHVSVEGVAISPLIFVTTGISTVNNKISMPQ